LQFRFSFRAARAAAHPVAAWPGAVDVPDRTGVRLRPSGPTREPRGGGPGVDCLPGTAVRRRLRLGVSDRTRVGCGGRPPGFPTVRGYGLLAPGAAPPRPPHDR